MNAIALPAPFWRQWWPLAAGVAVLLATSYYRFATGIWSNPNADHAPIVVAIALFLVWHERDSVARASAPRSVHAAAAFLAVGVSLFALGVRTRIAPVEALSHVPILAGALWLVGGGALVRRMWFALLFLVLSVPPPSFVLAQMTAGLKDVVSGAAVETLYRLGYPVARDGFVITIGAYRLLVAEACAGMNSIISLSALGLLLLRLLPPTRTWKLALALASIVPIAILANILRILLLSLVTYHLGDAAGQGFLHDFAGFAMFGCALAAFLLLARALSRPVRGEFHA
jgi:exosortase